MKSAGIREIKARLSHYLRLVEKGEVVLVTDRGEVVAQLAPPPSLGRTSSSSEDEALERLARRGLLRRAHGRIPSATAEVPFDAPPMSPEVLAAELARAREDRW